MKSITTLNWRNSYCQFFILFFCATISFNSNAQYSSATPSELERIRIENIKAGNAPDLGIFNELIFSFEDFDLLEKNYEAIEKDLNSQLKLATMELSSSTKQLKIIYPLEIAKSDEFLKLLKETLSKYDVYLTSYNKTLLIK